MTKAASPVYEEHFTRSPFQLLGGYGWKKLVAFRVDADGVLLGGAPARHRQHTARVLWQDIESVVMWAHPTAGPSPMRYVGVERRSDAPELPGPNRNLKAVTAAALAPHIDYEVFRASRTLVLWRVDRDRLEAAVNAFAPGVPVRFHPEHWG
ncbi:hypothetical protein [Streptomyces cucumeris]|uniref:hypothetical protein n=1 Tax=Streptomyces cucumeris TaxID=2962890 RepID=UPI0020C8C575|nr:hypothetical protein [Streptomyces sp. NEAU-Y11]MCP9206187.1 hypothetical protein [Streptomyces sp. NEAU-Y11]